MKKKIILTIITILLIAVISTVIYIIASRNNNVFSSIKILDTYGMQIENYNENTMPFVIQKANEETKIYVNGNEYNNERIYKVGEYEVIAKTGKKEEKNTIKIAKIEKKEENTYKIYVISETLQTLIANLNISDNLNQKGFLWTARTSTVDLEKVKSNISNMKISENNGELKLDEFKQKVIPELKEYIKTTLKENPNAYFELYMEEDKFYLDVELFGKIGLDDSRYDVTMYTNGTLGYTREYEITKKDIFDKFNSEKESYLEIVEKIKNNTKEIDEIPGSYFSVKASIGENEISTILLANELDFNYLYISILVRDNIKLLLQYPEMVIFEDEKVSQEMKKANIEKIVIQDEFNKLEDNEKNVFFDNIGLNKEELDKNYFTDETKEYLIITGTTPFYGEYGSRLKFENVIKQVVKDYSDKYVILYKPHPRELPTEQQEKFLNDLGIKVLPGKLPMEAICFVYPNLKLGGFDSSLYMSTDEGKTLFFFAKDKTELWSPLDVLYDTVFSEAKFYN